MAVPFRQGLGWQLVAKYQPELIVIDPVFFGPPGREVRADRGEDYSQLRRAKVEAIRDRAALDFCVNVAREQLRNGRKFLFEAPQLQGGDTLDGVKELLQFEGVTFLPRCRAPRDGRLHTSAILTNEVGVAMAIRGTKEDVSVGEWTERVAEGFGRSAAMTSSLMATRTTTLGRRTQKAVAQRTTRRRSRPARTFRRQATKRSQRSRTSP